MEDPFFLSLEDVLQIHAYQIAEFGGSRAVLESAKIASAIAQPSQQFSGRYLHEDFAAMAAAYLFHIVRNHAFEDGNKRTGTHAAIVFLAMNGYEVELPEDEAESLVLRVAQGQAEKPEVADFFRKLLGEASDGDD